MKIVNIFEKTIPFGSKIANSYINFNQMTGSIVAIETDVIRDGKPIIGYGFNSIGRYAPSSLLRDRMIPRLLNSDPKDILNEEGNNIDPFKVYKILTSNEKPGGHGDRAHAIGAIDMAVWDTISKIEGLPLWKLLADKYNNGKYDEKVYTYAAGGYYYPDNNIEMLKNEMKSYLDRGFTDVKMKIGGAPLTEDIKRLEAVIEVVGDASRVAVDANGKFNLEEALKYAEVLSQYNIKWYEEPVDPLDYRLHAVVADNFKGSIATGENLFSLPDIRNLIRHGGLRSDRDFIQMDCPLSYGLVEYMGVLDMLNDHGWSKRRCIPHGGHQMCLNMAAGLQLGGNECYPDVFKPFGGFADNIPVVNGYITLHDTPGIGFELKENLYKVMKDVIA